MVEYHTDSVYVTAQRVDTFIEKEKDSVVILQKGDTVFSTRIKTLYRERIREIHDTLLSQKTDSIPYEVRVEVEKKLTLWQEVKQCFGGWSLIALAVIIIYYIKRKKS
jgi:hypothetical protein